MKRRVRERERKRRKGEGVLGEVTEGRGESERGDIGKRGKKECSKREVTE